MAVAPDGPLTPVRWRVARRSWPHPRVIKAQASSQPEYAGPVLPHFHKNLRPHIAEPQQVAPVHRAVVVPKPLPAASASMSQQETAVQAVKPVLSARRAPRVPVRPLAPRRRRGPFRGLGRALRGLGSRLGPKGPGHHDQVISERLLNVATCAPFFQAGGRILRLCRSAAARRFGWAFVAVGCIASLYHSSWGRARPALRKLDYWAIALASMVLRSAVVGPAPAWLAAAMVAAIPFKPAAVSSVNFAAAEARYLALALGHPHLRPTFAAHVGCSAAATACFLDHSPVMAWNPFAHAMFHAFSAASFLAMPAALNHVTELAALTQPSVVTA
ncbi:hypothetical protein HYH03_004203 [Edaphochlamys debaryana]|uniref:Uncharacterized protein n=1 Tax=Edaphochlamys debaryana TaxID=47281 RepID=A0A835Y8F3_9CHLO|nr:hypothetical protein HYH03_004203 [Edaphochlamys debaryana]|eukprot:KAG2497941.1 hypothetical protein HYH03_004203 [Edaphochlamys debaryana]